MRHHHHHHPHHYGFLLGASGGAGAVSGGLKSGGTSMEMDDALEAAKARVREMNALSRRVAEVGSKPAEKPVEIAPLDFSDRTGNELRPRTFDGMVGQTRLKALFKRIVESARQHDRPIDHILLVGSAGTGKTTFATVLSEESGRRCFSVKAPVSPLDLEQLARACKRGDIVFVDECHLWVKPDRRGVNATATPEQVYAVLEDSRLQTATGVIPFPEVTWIGATTTTGALPEPFLARFPLQPHLDEYTNPEMAWLAQANAVALGMRATDIAAILFARACRCNPRQLNSYVRNARSLGATTIDEALATEIITGLNSTTLDGLNHDMAAMLRFLLGQRREDARGNVRYQAGLNTIATALGKSRDSQIVALAIEPWLIKQGYVAVTPGGRALTVAGVRRADQLVRDVGR